jgi:hypothetical protein
VSGPWGDRPAPEEARDELHDDLVEPTTDEADVEVAPDEAPADDDLVAGEGPVATAVARLDSLAELPPAEHVEVYEDVHRVLQDALADAAHDSGGDGGGTDGSGEDRTGSP